MNRSFRICRNNFFLNPWKKSLKSSKEDYIIAFHDQIIRSNPFNFAKEEEFKVKGTNKKKILIDKQKTIYAYMN